MKFESMMFYEGGDGAETEYIVRKSKYTKEEAIQEAIQESYDIAELSGTKVEIKEFNPDDFIKEGYVRFYPNLPEGFEIESGWTHCKKARGAIEVWLVDIGKIINTLR